MLESLLGTLGIEVPTDRLFHSDAAGILLRSEAAAIAGHIEELDEGYFTFDRRLEGRAIIVEVRPFAAAIGKTDLHKSRDNNNERTQ